LSAKTAFISVPAGILFGFTREISPLLEPTSDRRIVPSEEAILGCMRTARFMTPALLLVINIQGLAIALNADFD